MGEELGGGLGEGDGRGGEEVGGKGRRERERGDDGSRGENQNTPHLCTSLLPTFFHSQHSCPLLPFIET